MKILFAVSEAAPFAKTGGLADVGGSLPAALAARGHEVKVILPLYERVGGQWRDKMAFLKCFDVKLAWRTCYCGILSLEKDGVTYWFVDNEYYFKRRELYGHYDDGERFAFFSRAVIETPAHLDWSPDVIHCNDWQTALVPVYLLEERGRMPQLSGTKTVFTIHNIEYQGRYGSHTLGDLFGLSHDYLSDQLMGFHGDINLMKGGIHAADFVTTVSPTYAEEIQYSFYAHGLEDVVRNHRHKLRGILNGIDTVRYDPTRDPGLAQTFSAGDLKGRRRCKAALQEASGLENRPGVPVIGCVSRLVRHKGFDLVIDALAEIMSMDVQMVVLGTGDWDYEEIFRRTADLYPGRFAAHMMYSDAMATAIYGGADLFLMPSLSEPCGLSQMIAMRYGALPVVRETGGLRDTVTAYRADTGEGNGFTFANISAHDMAWVLHEAAELFRNDQEAWKTLQRRAMSGDFSWERSAGDYAEIYRSLCGC